MANRKVTLKDVNRIAARNRPWTLRLEYVAFPPPGANKFWFGTGRGTNESVEIGWGRIGNKPQYQVISFQEFVTRVNDKISKGYAVAAGPFVRMRPETIQVLKTLTAAATPPVQVSTPAAPVSISVPPPVQATFPPGTDPFTLIKSLTPIKQGFDALDANGAVLMQLTLDSGRDLIQSGKATLNLPGV